MHQKKSQVQIGKEITGVSSDFNPIPSTVHPKPPSHSSHSPSSHHHQFPLIAVAAAFDHLRHATPYKRPLLTQPHPSLPKSPTAYRLSPPAPTTPAAAQHFDPRRTLIPITVAAKSSASSLLRRFKHLRRLRVHVRLILLLSLPFFYFLVSHPCNSFLLDFISAFAFSAALLFSLNLALPRLPSILLFLARSFPITL